MSRHVKSLSFLILLVFISACNRGPARKYRPTNLSKGVFTYSNNARNLSPAKKLQSHLSDPLKVMRFALKTLKDNGAHVWTGPHGNEVDRSLPKLHRDPRVMVSHHRELYRADAKLYALERYLVANRKKGFVQVAVVSLNPRRTLIEGYVSLERLREVRKLFAFAYAHIHACEQELNGEISVEDFKEQTAAGYAEYKAGVQRLQTEVETAQRKALKTSLEKLPPTK